MDLFSVLPELIIGIILGAFAWAFGAWAKTLDRRSEQIITGQHKISNEQIKMAKDIHEHRLENESRLKKVETDLHHLFKRLDRYEVKQKEKSAL